VSHIIPFSLKSDRFFLIFFALFYHVDGVGFVFLFPYFRPSSGSDIFVISFLFPVFSPVFFYRTDQFFFLFIAFFLRLVFIFLFPVFLDGTDLFFFFLSPFFTFGFSFSGFFCPFF
jgi:hypothetical protein